MKILFCGLIFMCFVSAKASAELSELPTQDSLQALLLNFESQPTFYLPQYTDNPAEVGVADNHELIIVPNLDNNSLAERLKNSYQDNQSIVAEIKQEGSSATNKTLTQDLSQALATKYSDCPYCAEHESFQDNDFKQAASNLAVVSDAAHQAPNNLNEHAYSIFQGQAYECRKHGFGYLNCCSNSGWGQFVSQCSQEEIALRQAREKNTAIFLGTRKSGSKLKKKKYDVYCVFESKLARIIQEQGRFSQLYVSFGHAEAPNCRGISANELASINLDSVNLAEIYPQIASSIKPTDESTVTMKINKKIVRSQEKADADT